MINTNSPTTQQLELISQMSNWGDVGTITVKAMASELLSLRQQIAQMQAPAVEPAQAVPIDTERFKKAPCYICGYNSHSYYQPDVHKCAEAYHAALKRKQESAQEVPVGRVLHWKGDPGFAPKTCIRGFDEFPQGYAQLGPWEEGENVYTAPPAIDAEMRKMVLELCRLIIDKAGPDSMITRAMAQKAEKISERLEAGK